MGEPMARNLDEALILHSVWNRTPATAEAFAREARCHAAADLGELAAMCQVIVMCVSADEDVLEIVDGLVPHLHADDVIVDCSTVAGATAREAAERVAAKGAHFLDCPVSGGTEGARNGTLSIMVGGEAKALKRARPALDAMGSTIVHMGPVGSGQAAKATNQIMVAGINQAVTEALAFAQAQGLPLDAIIQALSAGAAANWFLEHRGPTMVRGRFPLGFKVDLHKKDLEICRAMAADHDVKLPVVEMTLVHYQRLLEAGSENEDISALFRLKTAMFEGAEGADR